MTTSRFVEPSKEAPDVAASPSKAGSKLVRLTTVCACAPLHARLHERASATRTLANLM